MVKRKEIPFLGLTEVLVPTEHKTKRKVKDTMFFSKQILLGCLVVLAISAFSEARMTRLVTRENWHKMFTMGKEPRGMFEDDYGYYFRRTLNSRRLRSAEARLVTSKKWQKRFAMGKEPRGMFEGAYNYYFRKTLQMHMSNLYWLSKCDIIARPHGLWIKTQYPMWWIWHRDVPRPTAS